LTIYRPIFNKKVVAPPVECSVERNENTNPAGMGFRLGRNVFDFHNVRRPALVGYSGHGSKYYTGFRV